MSLGDTNKYIQRLVRVISEKEKIIDQLRQEKKDRASINQRRSEAEISMVEQRLKEELGAVNGQVKKLLSKLQEMQVHINELNLGLQEEISLNQQLQSIIKENSSRQIQLLGQIKTLKEHFDRSKNDLLSKYEEQKKKAGLLEVQLEGLHHQIERQKILEHKIDEYAGKIDKYQNKMKSVQQLVEGIFTLVQNDNLEADNNLQQQYTDQQSSISFQLNKIQAYIKEKVDHDRSSFFNETIDGISIIMRSFEQKLQEVQYLTDRQALGCVKHQSLKESCRSVPPLPQRPTHNSSKETEPTLDMGSF